MFSGIGIWEVLLIIIVALIVLGPQRVPEIARKLGQILRAIRKASTDLSTAITREVDVTRPREKSGTPDALSGSEKATATKSREQPARPEGRQQIHE
jgi:Tat protein translocase TatB subunit